MTAVYADTRHATMQAVQATEGIKALCYDQQVALVESLIQPGMTVLDVGCGPALPYRAPHAYVIGLDPSAESLTANTDVDERICMAMPSIPKPAESVDLVVAFYSLHHMTEQTVKGSNCRAYYSLVEMARVLKPGGTLLVFEMRPHWWAYLSERALWDQAKALLGDRLDACFWRDDLYHEALGDGVQVQTFHCSSFETFAPIFALPHFKLPRLLYPFDAVCYRWTKE